MFVSRRRRPVVITCLLAPIVVLVSSASAKADAPDKGRCADAYEAAQRLDKSGKLVEALEQASTCANDACPAVLRSECIGWLTPLRARQSSLVIEARDGSAAEIFDMRVLVDGIVVQPRLEGRAFVVNPGRHTLSFERDSGRQTVDVVVREGEQGRRVVVRFDAAKASGVESERSASAPTSPTSGWVFGGIAVVGIGSFVGFGLAGKSLDGKLADQCAPRCGSDRVDSVRTLYTVADVSLGIGLVSAALATYFFLSHGSSARR